MDLAKVKYRVNEGQLQNLNQRRAQATLSKFNSIQIKNYPLVFLYLPLMVQNLDPGPFR